MLARKKGTNYELQVINLLKELGYTEACSSRSESKKVDDSGVDICFSGNLAIQCKAVESLGPIHPVIHKMPKKEGVWNLVFHKKNRLGTIVAMTQEDFIEILKLLLDNKLI